MSTDHVGPAPTERTDQPQTLDEALGGPGPTEDIRLMWDDLAETTPEAAPKTTGPSEPPDSTAVTGAGEQVVAAARAESLLIAPDAPVVLPPDDGPPPASPAAAPGVDDPGDARPTWRERQAERRRARAERRLDKDQRRSDRLELRRHRILPRTVIGISMLLLAAAVGAAASGAGLYAYYDWRLSENEDRVGTLTATLEERLTEANEDIENVQTQAVNNIREAAAPLEQLLTDTRTVSDLTPALAPSVLFISTLDADGAPSVGSGFVVSSDDSQSLLLTSYSTVAAATETPAPDIEVRGAESSLTGRLHSWDPDRDLALVIVDKGGMPPLKWASEDVRAEALGRRIYVGSGLGGAGVSLSPGLVIDQSQAGIQHSAPVGNAWQGGPVLTAEGEVLGIASLDYSPLGFDPGGLTFAVPVEGACERVLTCSGGDITG